MSETNRNRGLPVALDDVLRAWPDVRKREEDWEQKLQGVMQRVQGVPAMGTAAELTDDELLTSPLGHSDEDGHNSPTTGGSAADHPPNREETPMTMPADRERDRRNLQDLAKMASSLTPPPPSVAAQSGMQSGIHHSGVQRAAESTADDSGIVDLAAASQADPQASVRAQSTALASQGLFDDESLNVNRNAAMSAPPGAPFGGYGQPMQPVPTLLPPVPASVPPASVSQDAFASSPNAFPSSPNAFASSPSLVGAPSAFESQQLYLTPKKKGGKGIAAVLAVVALSAAATGFFYVRAQKSAAVASAPPVQKMEQPAAPKVEAPKPVVAEAAPTPEPTPAEPTFDPSALPAATPTTGARGKVAAATKGAKSAPAAFAPAPAKPEGPAKVTEKELAAAPTGPAGDLGRAMQAEVGDTGKGATPAAGGPSNAPTGNVPQKPSQGAVTGALGAVLPGARACLGPDDPISRASVIFSSGGTVQSVSVSGNAAGKPAEACIKSALMKAKVQPFAEATYTAPVTIRHN